MKKIWIGAVLAGSVAAAVAAFVADVHANRAPNPLLKARDE